MIKLVDQDYQYCLDYTNGKTNIMALNNINRIIKAVADGTPYEIRLRTDMIAILEELKKEIKELPFPQKEPEYMQGYSYCQMNILDYIIQDKIDKLKGNENGKDN